MIFRQFFDSASCTYTYLIASRRGGEALIIDPVLDKVDRILQLLDELNLKLIKAVDTHVHADHLTGLGALRDRTRCITVMGEQSGVDVVSVRVAEGDRVDIEGISLEAIYTPGHTDDSYSFLMADRVFTGDTLLIRGTGRTDFQNGDAAAQYDSIFNKLLRLADETLVYPAHDYKGDTVSTIGEEKAYNPRLQVGSVEQYVEIMNHLRLPNPKMMDVAVPANLHVGLAQEEVEARGWSLTCEEVRALLGHPGMVLVDLRDRMERERHGVIPGSVHTPYPEIRENVRPGGLLNELAVATSKRLIFYCAYGERSAMAVQTAQEAGLVNSCHIKGGLDAWKKTYGPLVPWAAMKEISLKAITVHKLDNFRVHESTIASCDVQEQEVQKWDAVAAGWARWWKVFERAAQPVSDRLVDLAGISLGQTVLDVATGLGEPAITAAQRVGPHGRVIATDCAPAMLREAAVRAQAMGLSNIEFRKMDAETPDLGDISFDAILCRWGFMFVPDLEGSLRRLLALLRPGGRFAAAAWAAPKDVPLIQTSSSVLSEYAPLPDGSVNPLNAFRLSKRGLLVDAMRQAGFADVTHEDVPVTFDFTSAEEYTRFRRDMTTMDADLAKHHPPDVIEAAWQAVTKAARAYATREGRVRFINTAVCFSGKH